MPLSSFLEPWEGVGVRHRPQGSSVPVTSLRFAGLREGRWNRRGEKAFYVACDAAVALNEYARWIETEAGAIVPVAREFFRLHLRLSAVLDLRRDDVQAALSIEGPADFLSMAKCQAYAAMARTTDAKAILVPPIGALDRPDSWNLVVFVDRFDDQATFVSQVEFINVMQVTFPSDVSTGGRSPG